MKPSTFWNTDLAQTLQSAESGKAWLYVFHTLRESIGLSSLAVIEYAGDAMPKVLLNYCDDDPVGSRISAYLKGAYLLDPFFHANLHESIDGVYSIDDLSKQNFGEAEYFSSFFSLYGLSDEINVIHQIADEVSIAISLGREIGEPKFKTTDHFLLRDSYSFLCQLAKQLREGAARHSSDVDLALRTQFHTGVKLAIDRLGSSLLTPREKTVFDLLIRGYSAKATATRLKIKEGTVRMHRYNIYMKLDVSSQTELFAFVVETLKIMDVTDGQDPFVLWSAQSRL